MAGWRSLTATTSVVDGNRNAGYKNRVSVRRGREYADDSPTRGVIVGGGHHSLSMNINRPPRV